MIESITIASVATYASIPETLSGLSQFNYLFGSNATGKTTVSRIIADEASFPTCNVTWKGGTILQPMVYNLDFVERNFTQSVELKGVFTLGEKQVDTLAKIATAKGELDALTTKIENLTQGLQGADGTGGKKGELAVLEAAFKDRCWAQKQKHDAKLKGAFEGYRNNAEKFKSKVLQELASNTATLQTQADLEKRAESVFGPTPTAEAAVASVDTARLQEALAAIIAAPSNFLDVEKLKTEKELLDTKNTLNNQRLVGKKKEASQVVKLESVGNIATAIKGLIDAANTKVSAHNKMVANLATERTTLTAQVWKFVLEELKTDIAAFKTAKDALDKAIAAMTAQIKAATTDKGKKAAVIRELEKQTTSVQPTIDGINQLLAAFGFQGFKLAKGASGTSYKLMRSDGTDAKATLSEGEKAFVTFLYFYHLLKGSESDSGMTTDRIVVFDDPVSSLDSDILFIVGSLIKGLFEEVRAGTGHIKQIFVLTHNVYFHKEVTYNSKRKDVAMNEETFWIVRKPGLVSKIDKHPTNPIKTSYELLWAEVRKRDRSNLGIQNTLRRILENYFKILGGIKFDQLCAMFDGKERLICKSLCSWVHDGSHYAHDDFYVSIDDSTVDNYLKVFRGIFDKSGHGAHYKMMMGDAFVEEPAMAATG